jgi:hypothetical protein
MKTKSNGYGGQYPLLVHDIVRTVTNLTIFRRKVPSLSSGQNSEHGIGMFLPNVSKFLLDSKALHLQRL